MSDEKKEGGPKEGGPSGGGFTEEESRIHQAGFKVIHSGLNRGLGFDEACAGLQVVDPEFRKLIHKMLVCSQPHFLW